MVNPSVALENVQVRVEDCRILDDVSLSSGTCEWTLLVGPSGCGKSTILRTINGLCTPSRGRVLSLGTWLPGRSHRQARQVWRATGTVLQEVALFETRTVLTNVELGCRAAGMTANQARTAALHWLDRLDIADRAAEYPAVLSGGQRQRVALARALAPRPRLLLLDEPTSALDHATASVVLDAIAELVEDGTCVVMSSHRPEEVGVRCTRCVVLEGGRLVQVTSGVPDPVHSQIPPQCLRTPIRSADRMEKNPLTDTKGNADELIGIPLVSRDEVVNGILTRTVILVEALPEEVFALGHLPGALNIRPRRCDELAFTLLPDQGSRIIVYCGSDTCDASLRIARRLRDLGYHNVYRYVGGKQDWIAAGLPVERGATVK